MSKLLVSERLAAVRSLLPLLALAVILGLTVAGSGPALSAMPPANAVATATAFGSSLTVIRPATVTSGDVLIGSVVARLPDTASITPPSGWTLIRRDSGAAGSPLTQALFYKVAGSSEASSYTWSFSAQASAGGSVIDAKGIDATSPIDSHSGAVSSRIGSILAPSVTTAAANELVLAFFGSTSSKRISPPRSMTEEFDVDWPSRDWSLDAEGAGYMRATAGPTGDVSASTRGRPTGEIGQLQIGRAHV